MAESKREMGCLVIGFLALGFLSELVVGWGSITATGGGIVEEGKNMVLKYDVGKQWTICYWYRFDTKDKYEYCLFTYEKGTSKVKRLECAPEAASKSMNYTGKSKDECTITVPNVASDDNKTWAVRVDHQMNNVPIDVTVAEPIESSTVEISPITAGTNGSIKCKVVGGRPTPIVTSTFEPSRDGLVTGSNMTKVADKDGIFTTELEIFLEPQIDDDGRNVSCSAVIFDGEKKALFKPVSSDIAQLNVVFPPQKAENQTLEGKIGDNMTVSFDILANPKPSVVTWTVLVAKKIPVQTQGNETKFDIRYDPKDFTLGQGDDKYSAGQLAQEDRNKYKATFNILNADKADHSNRYKLVASSSLGQQTYFFKISLDGVNDNDGESTTTIPNALGIGLGVAAAIIVVGVVIGLIAMRKCNKRQGETAPLAG